MPCAVFTSRAVNTRVLLDRIVLTWFSRCPGKVAITSLRCPSQIDLTVCLRGPGEPSYWLLKRSRHRLQRSKAARCDAWSGLTGLTEQALARARLATTTNIPETLNQRMFNTPSTRQVRITKRTPNQIRWVSTLAAKKINFRGDAHVCRAQIHFMALNCDLANVCWVH